MTYLAAVVILLVIVVALALVAWGPAALAREKPAAHFITATASLPDDEDYWGPAGSSASVGGGPAGGQPSAAPREGFKERYGEPPGNLRSIHQDELGFRGWADMPGDFEGSSASAVSAYIMRSA